MRRFAACIVFAIIYGLLLLLTGIATDQFGPGAFGVAAGWIAPFVAAPLALMVATRFGRLTYLGVAITSTILAALVVLTTVGILVAIAVPAVGGPTLGYIVSMFASYFTIGGWRLVLSLVLFIAVPPLWLALLLSLKTSRAPAAA